MLKVRREIGLPAFEDAAELSRHVGQGLVVTDVSGKDSSKECQQPRAAAAILCATTEAAAGTSDGKRDRKSDSRITGTSL